MPTVPVAPVPCAGLAGHVAVRTPRLLPRLEVIALGSCLGKRLGQVRLIHVAHGASLLLEVLQDVALFARASSMEGLLVRRSCQAVDRRKYL